MRTEHLKWWLNKTLASGECDPPKDPHWGHRKVIELVCHCWDMGNLPKELTWCKLVLLPKGDGAFRGIGLLEIAWKLLESIINARLGVIQYHDSLHGF